MENTNLLKTSLSEFTNADELYNYIKNYLTNSGIVSVADVSETIKNNSGLQHIFTVDFMNQYEPNGTQKRYYVIICPLEEDLKKLIGKIQSGLNSVIPYRKVALGYFNYDYNTKNMAKSIGLELLGYNDILEINNAIDSGTKGLPYLTLSSSFVAGLAKNLNSKYKFIGGNTVGTELNNQLSGLSEAINDGFNQLKGSLGSLFNRNTPNSQFSNSTGGQAEQYNQQANMQQQTVEHTEQNTEQYQVVNEQCNKQDEQLKEEKKSGVNLNKDTEDKENEPISLKKD